MAGTNPPLLGLALRCACEAFGWTQKELAAANHISQSTVSEYISGVLELTLERFEELITKKGGGADDVQNAIAAARLIHRSPPAPATPVDPTPEERRVIDRATGRVMHRLGAEFKERLVAEVRLAHADADRAEAEALWRRLAPRPVAERRRLVEKVATFQVWALAVRLCAKSEDMAPGCAVEALELAELARLVARLAVVPEIWRPCLEGYTVVFIANAHRVGGRLNPAEAAFSEALELLKKGTPGEPGLLDEGRVLDLEASLRRDQRRFDEALSLHERALAVTPMEESGYILLNQAFTFEQSGDYEQAISTLTEAAPRVDGTREPRLLCVLLFNRAVSLCHLDRSEEAESLLPEVRSLTRTLKKESDRIRLRWLEGKVAAGRICSVEAIPALEEVRQWFAAKDNPYDTALATLELATLYLEEAHSAKVKELVREMAPIFEEQKIHREALAALILFRDAALQETATAALARRLVRYLTEARHDPERRFEG
ncbi:MAG TPA: helix-turn-helix transcriptional regulator [Thermoanaerobaculia bacterium]|jgi:tetratricopeptide (TPR) repeat protein|nr:helix-turn-helix transcriptional regulator [Thermoanaerobaculia bacterium]